MYKLKYKFAEEKELNTRYFLTLQGVAEQIAFICGAENLADAFKVAKEFNIRFYLSYKK